MKVVGYIRVSTDEQAEHGHSLEAQETLIRQFAASRGWEVVHIYRDAGLSGRHSRRPGLAQMIEDAEAHRFEAVIVHAIDRLYRNLEALLKSLQLFQTHNVAFVSITENMDFTTPWGKLALAVLGTLAEIYIDKLSAETSKGKHQRARKGLWNGSIPLGYCNGQCAACTDPNGPDYCPNFGNRNQSRDQSLIFHPIESEAIRLAFNWYVTGNYSDGQIAAKLNAHRHRLSDGRSVRFRTKRYPSRGGPGPFSKDSVREILTRVFYTGVVPYYGVNEKGQKRKRRNVVTLYPGQHPALIDQTTFDRALEIRKLLGRNPRKRRQTPARIYPLSGLLHCNQCRGKMRAQSGSGNGKRYYICVTRLQRTGPCRQSAITAGQIEAQLLDFLKHIKLPANWQRQVLRDLGQDPDELERKRTEIKSRLARATKLYLTGLLSEEDFEQERHQAEFKLADLPTKTFSDIISVSKQLQKLQEQPELVNIEIKKLLRGLVTAVFAEGDTLSAIQFNECMYPLLKQASTLADSCFYSGSDGCSLFWK